MALRIKPSLEAKTAACLVEACDTTTLWVPLFLLPPPPILHLSSLRGRQASGLGLNNIWSTHSTLLKQQALKTQHYKKKKRRLVSVVLLLCRAPPQGGDKMETKNVACTWVSVVFEC